MFGQLCTGLGVQPGAIRPANRLERQCKHYRVSDDGFKIHVIILNFILTSFIEMIREKLLKLDLKLNRHVVEASSALSGGHHIHFTSGQNALVNRLQTQVEFDRCTLNNGDQRFAPLLGCGHVDNQFAHHAGLADEVANEDVERVTTHPASVRVLALGKLTAQKLGHDGWHVGPHVAAKVCDLANERARHVGVLGVRQHEQRLDIGEVAVHE